MGSARKMEKAKGLRVDLLMDVAAFSLNLRDADLARVELDRELLQFERERSETDRSGRKRERQERREERENMQEPELAKYKLLIEVLKKK